MNRRLEEIKLIAQCALADNRQAFGRLVDMHTPTVKRFIANLVNGDMALTDDLAQETFIKAYLSIRSYKGLSSFSTWLYRIAYNEYVSWMRKHRESAIDEIPDVAAEEDECDRSAALREALDRLPEPHKAIITLFYIEDQPIKKIAVIMDMPENTVKVYLMRGRDRLRKIVAPEKL